jgi:hypothetical protein
MPSPVFDPPTPELIALQKACNADLAGAAKVHIFVRTVGEHKQWCVLVEWGSKRETIASDQPLNENDKERIVKDAMALVNAAQSVHSKYAVMTSDLDGA